MPEKARSPVDYARKAEEELSYGRMDRAGAYFNEVLKAVPGEAWAIAGLAEVEKRGGPAAATWQEGLRAPAVIPPLAGELSDLWIHIGDRYLASDHPEVARSYWEKAVSEQGSRMAAERIARLGPRTGERRRLPRVEVEFSWVPPGRFVMGCVPSDTACDRDEKPAHKVALKAGYWLASTEVTVAQYREFAAKMGRPLPPPPSFAQTETDPVVNVSWDDAVAYCGWLGGRLPTEAEWEFAARGGPDGDIFAWGHAALPVGVPRANLAGEELRRVNATWPALTGYDDGFAATAPVGSFPNNAFGLHDMTGNVREWCADWYGSDYFQRSKPEDPPGPAAGVEKVARGGGWDSESHELRLSDRFKKEPTEFLDNLGFRCVLDSMSGASAAMSGSSGVDGGSVPPDRDPSAQSIPFPEGGGGVPRVQASEAKIGGKPEGYPASVAPTEPRASAGESLERAEVAPGGIRADQSPRRFPPSDSVMVWVPPGSFEMGCVLGDVACFNDEQPRHEVTFTRGFWISATEVTVGAFRRFAAETGHPMAPVSGWQGEGHPVAEVTWQHAANFCHWAGGRLPTEAEWECAARGGKPGAVLPWGDAPFAGWANSEHDAGRGEWTKTAPVGSYPSNSIGLFDMAGNVREWCADWYRPEYYATGDTLDPGGPIRGSERVIRGGAWFSDPGRLRLSSRSRAEPEASDIGTGFRCVLPHDVR